MNLEKYLNDNFPGPFADDFLKEHFKSFGVNISIEGNKFLFKYDMIEADWNNPLTHFCRGAILRYEFGIGWEYVCRPWNKFFNRQEGRSNYSTKDDIKKLQNHKVELVQKMDGSCVTIWFDEDLNDFRASTLGSISTTNISDFDMTFSDLFWKLFGNDKSRFVKGTTSLFELCTVYNRVVTEYPEDHITYLGTYSNTTGEYLEALSEQIGTGLKKPIRIPFDFSSWDELDQFVEDESRKSRYGKNSEGFVCYVDNYPAFKCKNENYLNLHHLFTGDKLYVRKNIVNLFFQGKMDDLEQKLPEELKKFKDNLYSKYEHVLDEIFVGKNLVKDLKQDRKEYALKIQDLSKKYNFINVFQGYFYELLKGDQEFSEWLTSKNKHGNYIYESYMDFWKDV